MAINDMDVNQAATILNAALNQAQGNVNASTSLDTSSFVTLAQTALKVGLDKLNTGLSQVLTKTIFAARPYNRKLQILEADSQRWGNHVRKINYVEQDLTDSKLYNLTDGQAVDMYTVRKPKAVQTNYYGFNTFDYDQTVYKKQLEMSLRGPEEWAGWLSGLLQHIQNKMEQTHDVSARLCLANFAVGMRQTNAAGNIVHLLTEYNEWAGTELTAQTVYAPDNFPGFARWMYGRIETLSRMMTERSDLFHAKLTAGRIERHTPVQDQRLIMLAAPMTQIGYSVLSTTFNTEYMRMLPSEQVNYWQNINVPYDINAKASYINAAGEIVTMEQGQSLGVPIFGILFDKDAMGYTTVGEEYAVTPYNIKGKYWNHNWSFQDRYWNDFTENAVLLALD